MVRVSVLMFFALLAGCTTVNVTTSGDVTVDAHKEITVSDPTASVGIPVL